MNDSRTTDDTKTTTVYGVSGIHDDVTQLRSQAISISVACMVIASSFFVSQSPVFTKTLVSAVGGIQYSATSVREVGRAVVVQVPVTQLWRGYVTLGQEIYTTIGATEQTYHTLITHTARRALVLGEVSIDAFQAMPARISWTNIALGEFVIGATHAAIRADVSLAYGLAEVAPVSARITFETVGMVGDRFARVTANIPSFASEKYIALTSVPSHIAPVIAEAVWRSKAVSRIIRGIPNASQVASVFLRSQQ